jgi:hypothetical protein
VCVGPRKASVTSRRWKPTCFRPILGFRRLVKEAGFPELCGLGERRAQPNESNWMKITTDHICPMLTAPAWRMN